MLPSEFELPHDEFPPIAYEQWRKLAEADLGGASFEQKLVTHTYEGIDIRPVYTRSDAPGEGDPHGFPGLPPLVRGGALLGASQTGWDLRQEHAHPDLQTTHQAILDDLAGGVTSLLVRLDLAARSGLDPDHPAAAESAGRDGVMVYTAADLDALFQDVHLQMIGVSLEAGAAFLPAAALLAGLWRSRDVSNDQARGAFNADPFAVLVRDGQLPISMDSALAQMAELASWTASRLPQVTAVRVGTAPYHHAGATAVQDIGFGVATGVAYLRAMTAGGLTARQAARQMVFSISLGTHHFLAIAKLRAARRLWSRVLEACGVAPEDAPMRIHARTSKRVLTYRDPYVNLLRNAVAMFAGGLGGAEILTSTPFDVAAGLPDTFSRRIARNTALVLQEEGHLHRVIDPAGGSWYLDWLTDQVAEKGWEVFQQIEQQGGMLAAIRSGWVAQQIDNAFAPRARNLARRKEGITGVSEFPNIGEAPIARPVVNRLALREEATVRIGHHRRSYADVALSENASDRFAEMVEAAVGGATLGGLAAAIGFQQSLEVLPPLTPHPFAQPFEELRDASDRYADLHNGHRPRVFLANMGPISHHTARATYAKNFFAAGGFEVIDNDGFRDADAAAQAFADSKAGIAVICSSDKLYVEAAPQLARKLKEAGAKTVVLAGNPGANEEAWRAAGVDRFIFIKCDVLSTLREMLHEEGVLTT